MLKSSHTYLTSTYSFALLCLMACFINPSLAQQLSPSAQISLLTAGPYEDLYSSFGHTAIRVDDPRLGIDKVYNYGTFDYDAPFFYVKFARGKLNYKLDVDPYRRTQNSYGFLYIYQYFDRTIDEQILNLSQEQKQAIFDFLENNYLPENRFYLYDFFFDNCATRLRDIFKQTLGDSLIFHYDYLTETLTFRELVDRYLQEKPWGDLGIDLALGAVIDCPIKAEEYMFHPDYLALALEHAELIRNGQKVPLVAQKIRVYQSTRTPQPPPVYLRPIFVFSLLAIIVFVATFMGYRNKTYKAWIDAIVFGIAGIGGLILFLLMTATDHTATAWNMNALWLLPTHLALPFVLFRSKRPRWLKIYMAVSAILILLLLIGWPLWPQQLNPDIIPVMLILLVRAVYVYQVTK